MNQNRIISIYIYIYIYIYSKVVITPKMPAKYTAILCRNIYSLKNREYNKSSVIDTYGCV